MGAGIEWARERVCMASSEDDCFATKKAASESEPPTGAAAFALEALRRASP